MFWNFDFWKSIESLLMWEIIGHLNFSPFIDKQIILLKQCCGFQLYLIINQYKWPNYQHYQPPQIMWPFSTSCKECLQQSAEEGQLFDLGTYEHRNLFQWWWVACLNGNITHPKRAYFMLKIKHHELLVYCFGFNYVSGIKCSGSKGSIYRETNVTSAKLVREEIQSSWSNLRFPVLLKHYLIITRNVNINIVF